jgi:hypothetical protein
MGVAELGLARGIAVLLNKMHDKTHQAFDNLGGAPPLDREIPDRVRTPSLPRPAPAP